MPWGNRSALLGDPGNFFTPLTSSAIEKFAR
jgi:hypothetical protein